MKESSRLKPPPLLAILLMGTLLVATLAVQVWSTQRSHREVTEDVLRDYAALAADEALRRIAIEVGFYGYVPTLDLLRSQVDGDSSDWLVELELPSATNAEQRRALGLVAEPFVVDFEGRQAEQPLEPWLAELQLALGDIDPNELVFHARTIVAGGQPAAYVVSPVEAGSRQLIGFRIADDALTRGLTQVLESRPLLPSSLGEGDLDNSVLYLRVTNRLDDTLYVTGSRYESALIVEREPPPDYQKVIDGLTVRAAIDPRAAHRLVIGGLPRSRLPLLFVLLFLTLGLLATSVVLLRRERNLARLRTDFVSRVSHELRTPLAQIRMFSETLRLDRVRSDDERARYLEILEREARRLSALVENVLQFSRSERDLVEIHPSSSELAPFIERMIEEVSPSLDHDAEITVVVEPGLEALIDPDAIHQALLNLLDNAVKFGGGEPIRVTAESAGDRARIAVEDRGPGIPLSERELVWRPFERSKDSAQTGTGIGLAVVRDIVEQHGGRCWIESGEPRGTRVVMELPVAEVAS